MRNLTLLFTIAGLSIGGIAETHAQSQAEMNATAEADLAAAHAKLNSLYKKVLSTNADDKQFCSDLKEAQRAWLKYMEFHVKTLFPVKEGEDPRSMYGSMYSLDVATEQTEMIEARCKELSEMLQN
ncbi:MAG: lysozyme inhibitor LprI family protein [Verrucomicrobiota bacterium]